MISRIALLIAMAVMILPTTVVIAQTSSEYADMVATRCETVKQLVDRQRRNDLVARINKGRAYQTIIDQQNAFSLRLRNNKVTPDAFDRKIAEVQNGVNRFRAAYNTYDDSLDKLLDVDCKVKPQEFIQQLDLARSQRVVIGDEVAAINTSLASYRQEVVVFRQEIERLNSAILGESQ